MKNFLTRALVALFCLAPVPVFAQAMVVTTCGTLNQNYVAGATRQATVDVTGKLCTNVTGAAGGTSATDNSVFTTGTTSVTPSGALYNDAATATSGNIAAPRMTSKRAQIVDVDTTGNALYTAITAPVPACSASPCTTVIGGVVLYQGTTALSTTNGLYSNLLQGNAVISATNGLYSNLLQGNAVISATNGLYANQLQGNAVLSATNPSFTRLTDGTNAQVTDPCNAVTKLYKAFSQTATAVLVSGTSAKKTYVCSIAIIAGAAEIFNLTAGTGSTCGTNTVAVMGSTTAANGLSLAANGGLTLGNGASALAATTVNADDLCLQQSGSNRLSGGITYVQL